MLEIAKETTNMKETKYLVETGWLDQNGYGDFSSVEYATLEEAKKGFEKEIFNIKNRLSWQDSWRDGKNFYEIHIITEDVQDIGWVDIECLDSYIYSKLEWELDYNDSHQEV